MYEHVHVYAGMQGRNSVCMYACTTGISMHGCIHVSASMCKVILMEGFTCGYRRLHLKHGVRGCRMPSCVVVGHL